MASNFRRTTSIITVSQIINYTLPLLTFPLLVKTFDVRLYGVWIEANTIVGLLSTFSSIGLGNALAMKAANSAPDQAEHFYANALYTFLSLCGGLTVLMWVAAPLLNDLTVRDPIGLTVIHAVAPLVLTSSLNWLASQVCRIRQKPLTFATLDVSLSVAKLVAVILATFHRDLVTFAVTYVLLQSLFTLIEIGVSYRGITLRKPSWAITKDLLRAGVNLSLVSQTNWIVMFGDRLMLSVFATTAAVAIYSASYQLTLILVALGSPYLYALLPILGERWNAGDVAGAQAAIRQSTRAMFIILVPAVIGLTLTGNVLLKLLATEGFAQGALLIGLIALGVALDTIGTNLQYIFYAQNRPQVLRHIYLRAAVFNLIGNLIAIPLLSYYGAGIMTLLTFVIIIAALLKQTQMPLAQLFDLDTLLRCAAACLPMGVWVAVIVDSSIIRLVIAVLGGGLIYGIGILALRVASPAEIRKFIASVLRRSG
ncbi:MAG: oligosaccharide flippase family protein [Anaerolineae bacterium]|nr:oligosaccharide flippase family protein [Anaerolineae bacterium]